MRPNQSEVDLENRVAALERKVFGADQRKSTAQPEPEDKFAKARRDAQRLRAARDEPKPPDQPVKPANPNLNTDDLDGLQRIKGVGAKTAEDILAHREEAPFESIEDAAERVGGLSLEILNEAGAKV